MTNVILAYDHKNMPTAKPGHKVSATNHNASFTMCLRKTIHRKTGHNNQPYLATASLMLTQSVDCSTVLLHNY